MEQRRYPNGMMIHAIHRAHRNAVQAELNALGLDTVGSPMILMMLRRREQAGEGMIQRELAQALHISPAAVAMALKPLERVGYVQRRGDPRDQRRKRIAITEKGAAAVEQCRVVMDRVDARMMEGFSPDERMQLDRFQQRMITNLLGPEDGHLENPFERMGYHCSRP